jgi:hypothetical protein
MRMAPRNAQISQKYEQVSEETEKIDLENVIPRLRSDSVDISVSIQNHTFQSFELVSAVNDLIASADSTPPVISVQEKGAAARMA